MCFLVYVGGLFKLYPKFWVLYEEYSTKYQDALRCVSVCLSVCVVLPHDSSAHVLPVANYIYRLLRWKQDNDPAFVNFLSKKRGAARHTLESLMLLPVTV